jgi:predicted amidohydrolase
MNMAEDASRQAKIGLIQVSSDSNWSVEQCLEEMLMLSENCLKEGADLVFMPEANQYKGVRHLSKKELAINYAEDYKQRCAQLARKYQAYVVPWDYEVDEQGKTYNTSYILDRNGEEIGRYRKVIITYNGEQKGETPGSSFPVFDLDFGRVGIMICFDNYYAEAARCLALQGAELILYPLYGDTLKDQWEIRTRARAIDNSVFVAPCHIHSSPKEADVTFTGMIDPTGNVIAKLTEEGTSQVVSIEMGRKVITCTRAAPGLNEDIKQYLLRNRRHGIKAFQPLVEPVEIWDWDQIEIRND